jgi:hypothetical protein
VDHLAFGMSVKPEDIAGGLGGMPPMTLVVKTKVAVSQERIRQALGTGPAKKAANGKEFFAARAPAGEMGNIDYFLHFPSDRTILITTVPEPKLNGLLALDGKKAALPTDTMTMLNRIGKAHIWAVFPLEPFKKDIPKNVFADLNLAETKIALTEGLTQAKVVGFWMRGENNNKDGSIFIGALCKDNAGATKLKESFQRAWDKELKTMAEGVMAFAGGQMPPDDAKTLKDAINKLKISADGDLMTMSIRVEGQMGFGKKKGGLFGP